MSSPIGARTPLLHLAFSKHIHTHPEKREAMLPIAGLLHAQGADPNDGYSMQPGSVHRVSALYGALGHADNPVLAEWLLAHGATPDDDESLYHATELGHLRGLELLMRHGARARGTNALPRALDFNDPAMVRLLLEYGADPNEAVRGHPSGEPVDSIPALHQATRRWCAAEIAELLLQHGADPHAHWQGHTPYALARIYGIAPVARLLEGRGLATPLSDIESTLAACAEVSGCGDRAHRGVTRSRGPAPALPGGARTDPACAPPGPGRHRPGPRSCRRDGADTPAPGLLARIGGTRGLSRVAYLLTLGPDLARRNDYGGDALDTTVHGAEFAPRARRADHVACARLLLEAGAELRPEYIEGCGDEALAVFLESWGEA